MSNRRDFLKKTALLSLATPLMSFSSMPESDQGFEKYASFKYRNGKFKILHLTDTHYIFGDERSQRALNNVRTLLDAEKPDLVIHTGDVIFGPPAKEGLKEILSPMAERNIPFAVTLGNHDQEQGLTRQEVYDYLQTLPCNVNTPSPSVSGCSNDLILLKDSTGNLSRAFYLFDSRQISYLKDVEGWGYIGSDQVEWYKLLSKSLTERNHGTPVPSFAFFHIPLQEYSIAIRMTEKRQLRGIFAEEPCPQAVNSGLFLAAKEQGDIEAIFNGHDHNNDCALYWNKMFMVYGRFSGCDTVYNDLMPNGGRVIELTEGEEGFRSWVRLSDGSVQQDLRYPKDWVK